MSKTGFVQPHIALVLRNGSVWDISLKDDLTSVDMKFLIQLPQGGPKQLCYPFSTKGKVLNFVRNDLGKKIIQYHEDSNNQGLVTIRNSGITLDFSAADFSKGINLSDQKESRIKIDHSIQVGKMLWMIAVISQHGNFNI